MTELSLRDAAAAGTTVDWLLQHLKDDVLTGRLAPGTRLVERDLSERYGVSRTPLREALSQLVLSQLAINIPYRGVFIRVVDLEFARDVYEVRSALEGLAGSLAAQRATKEDVRSAESYYRIIERLSRSTTDDQAIRDDIMRHNMLFHRAIAIASHNALLLNKIDEIWTSVGLVRFNAWQTEERVKSSMHEHHDILEALRAGDAALLGRLCAEHAMTAWGNVERVLSARKGGA